MGKDKELNEITLSAKQKRELDDAWDEIMNEAKNVVEDYTKNPSELSGSAIEIHEDSPFVDETLTFNNWKNVVRGNILTDLQKKSKKDVDKKKKK